jgi:hypothetical protein
LERDGDVVARRAAALSRLGLHWEDVVATLVASENKLASVSVTATGTVSEVLAATIVAQRKRHAALLVPWVLTASLNAAERAQEKAIEQRGS